MNRYLPTALLSLVFGVLAATAAEPVRAADPSPDYTRDIAPILRKYCVGCHNDEDREGKLSLESFAAIGRGGENGTVLVPGKADKSRLLLLVQGKAEPVMPPEGSAAPSPAEIATLSAWIKAGAHGPTATTPDVPTLQTPEIAPRGEVRRPITAISTSADGKWTAIARHNLVELLDETTGKPVQQLTGHTGQINDIAFSADGSLLTVAAGEPGLYGEVTLWEVKGWERRHVLRGHGDSLYAVAISPDGRRIATGSYDQRIRLWEASTGEFLRELKGHNGAVFDLAFHPGGRILASASGDRTVKLWDVDAGTRLETLSEPEKDQYTVAFRPDGRFLVAGGVDNRIRVWELTEAGREGTNPLRYVRFAHEGAILRLTFSADGQLLASSSEDRTIKLWNTRTMTQARTLPDQPDWVSSLAITAKSRTLLAGRLDGSLATYDLSELSTASLKLPDPVTSEPLPPATATSAGEPLPAPNSEAEPNDQTGEAQSLALPAVVKGVLNPGDGAAEDTDLYAIECRAGEVWMVETNAARSKSPADTRIEVLDATGQPVLRYQLRAVRDSWITFRPIDSSQRNCRVKYWEEMELNQFLYLNGEVCKLFRMPEGPDSGFLFYGNNNGKRLAYFDSSPTVHALEDPVYIVEPYLPTAELIDNGLPVFPLYYANDDDGQREWGNDSRLTFTAPADGKYFIQVRDTRSFGGADYRYTLTLRRPQPDFGITVSGKDAKIAAGSGQEITFKLDRHDNFNGPVKVEVSGLPEGFTASTPTIIEAGHLSATMVLHAAAEAAEPTKEQWQQVQTIATADIHDRTIERKLGDLGTVTLQPKPKVLLSLETDPASTGSSESGELVIRPGTTITAWLKIERNGANGPLRFDVNNLPHGVIVDNLGLNGITLLPGQTQRRLFLTASDWVPESSRLIHAICRSEGKPCSLPIRLTVTRASAQLSADATP